MQDDENMKNDIIEIPTSTVFVGIGFILVIILASGFLLNISFLTSPFSIATILSLGIIAAAAFFAYEHRSEMGEMHCMMNGMAFGMMASFMIGALLALPSGDFMLGIIAGTVAGILIGVPLAKNGGHLAMMEGVMAAPMGGSMGAMLGVMIRFYNIQLFMQFLFVTLIITMYGMTRMNASSCKTKIPSNVFYIGLLFSIIALASTFFMPYTIDTPANGLSFGTIQGAEQQLAGSGQVQEVTIRMDPLGYTPDFFTVKKGIPVKINLQAATNAGCTRSIVFPDFGISKVVPAGKSDTIQFTPTKTGTFQFRCSMAMARGSFVVEN